jgi:hypothetical protein
MRTTKRFTPTVLDRFEREKRGSGVFEQYTSWHRVTRGDPASRGRSHIVVLEGKEHDLLSDSELTAWHFALLTPDVIDIRTQFPLALRAAPHELGDYLPQYSLSRSPGTLELCSRLGIKHPVTRDKGTKAPWTLTTDILLTLDGHRGLELLAVSSKPDEQWRRDRPRELLALEQEYWRARGVPWLLVTPGLFSKEVALTLMRTACWALTERASELQRRYACLVARRNMTLPLREVLNRIAFRLGDISAAQRALWQAVWAGELPIDLRRGHRTHTPLSHLSPAEFHALNPIASRRTAWN